MLRLNTRAAVVVLIGLLGAALTLAVPSVANASTVISNPPPVAEIPDVPSRTAKALSGSRLADNTAISTYQVWKALMDAAKNGATKGGVPAPGTLTPPGTVTAVAQPKPITGAAPLVRGANAAGAVMTAASLGWGIGQGGLYAYSAITGTDHAELICGQPDWYQSANNFLMMGLTTPTCPAPILQPNNDVPAGMTAACYQGYCTQLVGTGKVASNGRTTFCYLRTGPAGRPTGVSQGFPRADGNGFVITSPSYGYTPSGCGGGTNDGYLYQSSWETNPSKLTPGALVYFQNGQVVGNTPTSNAPDPRRRSQCQIEWIDGSTTEGLGKIMSESEGFSMTPSDTGCKLAWDAKPGAGTDVMPEKISVDSENQDTGARTRLSEQEVPDFGPDGNRVFEPGNGRGLVLEKIVNDQTLSCMTWAADCAQWWPKTEQGTKETTDTGTYRCSYGGHQIALNECGPYRETFDTKTGTPTITDPETGTKTPWEAAPETGNTTNPGTGPAPGETCMAQWASTANPIDWVLHPIKCGMVWSWIPRQEVVDARLDQIDAAAQRTPVAKVATFVGGLHFTPPGNGCSGVVVPVSQWFSWANDFRLLNACPGESLHFVAQASNIAIGLFSVLGTIFVVTRNLAGVVGYRGMGGESS